MSGIEVPQVRIALVSTIGATLDAFFVPHVERWRQLGAEVVTVAGDAGSGVDVTVPMSRSPLAAVNLHAVGRMQRVLRRIRPTHVVVTTPVAAAVCRLASVALSPRPRVCYVAQGFHFRRDWRRQELPFLVAERLLAPLTDVLITIAEEDFDHARRWRRPLAPRRIVGIRGIGVDLPVPEETSPRRHPAPRFRPPGASGIVVGYLGELNDNKRVELVVEAMRHLPPGSHLLVAGTGPADQRLRRLVAELDLPVEFLGWVDDPQGLLAEVDALVLPSAREGIPRCVLEAMALRRPVVATPNRGTEELLGDGCGFLVAPDPAAIAQAVITATTPSDERATMLEAAARRVRDYAVDPVRDQLAVGVLG